MNNSTKAVFGKRALGQVFADDYIDWAIAMLMEDYDSPNLRILAGLDRRSSFFEVEAYFLRSIKELGIEEVEPENAIRSYACETAQQIIDGQFTSPHQAIETMYRLWLQLWVARGYNYDPDYEIWIELHEALTSIHIGEFPYSYPSATLKNIDEVVKQEAARFIVPAR